MVFSAWIECKDERILFDTGFSDLNLKNAEHAGIDLNRVDIIALSHFHRDHARGLLLHPFDSKVRLALHPRDLSAAQH